MSRELIAILTVFATAMCLAGCVTVPEPFVTDFSEESVRVSVNYGSFGPSAADARVSSVPVAVEQCAAFDRFAELVSSFEVPYDTYNGTFVFLYRCVR